MAETDNVEELKAKEEPTVEVETEVEAEVESATEDEVSAEMKELLEFKDKFYYVAAEMENLKKRHERDMQNQIKYGSEKILKGLLEVVDNLERTSCNQRSQRRLVALSLVDLSSLATGRVGSKASLAHCCF